MPIVLTVMATILAGLSSSEMTQSMYFRSLAAQHQSKAGAQWAFFQAKRIRGTTMESGGDLILALADPPPIDAARLRLDIERLETAVRPATGAQALLDAVNRLKQILTRESIRQSLKYIGGSELPPVAENRTSDEQIQAVTKEIAARKTEAQTLTQVVAISTERIEKRSSRPKVTPRPSTPSARRSRTTRGPLRKPSPKLGLQCGNAATTVANRSTRQPPCSRTWLPACGRPRKTSPPAVTPRSRLQPGIGRTA